MKLQVPKILVRITVWAIVYILLFTFVTKVHVRTVNPFQNSLVMTSDEQAATDNAVKYVLEGINKNTITTTEIALDALQSELPMSVRDDVKKYVGSPSFDKVPIVLNKMVKNIKVKK